MNVHCAIQLQPSITSLSVLQEVAAAHEASPGTADESSHPHTDQEHKWDHHFAKKASADQKTAHSHHAPEESYGIGNADSHAHAGRT